MNPTPGNATDETTAPTHVRYGVLAMLCAAAMIAYISRNSIAVAEEAIRKDLDLGLEDMGWMMGAFFLSYALFQIPGGWLGDRWGSRRALTVYALTWSVATAAMGLAAAFWTLLAARLILGISQAGLFPCCINTIKHWIPATRHAVAAGSLASFMSIGGALAVALTGAMLDGGITWPWVFVIFAVPGVGWGLWFLLWFRDRPEEHRSVNEHELHIIRGPEPATPSQETKSRERREPTPWRALYSSPTLWFICGQQFFRSVGYVFYASWFPTFLKETRGISTEEAGYLTSLPLLAVVVGSPLGGVLVDWLWARTKSRRISRQGVAVLSMLACAALILAAYYATDAVTAVLLITAGSFFAGTAGSCGYAISIDMGGKHVGTVFSTMNMAGNIGAAICPRIVAWFVLATHENWNLVLVFFAVVYAAAAACWAAVNPNGTIGEPTPRSQGPNE